MKTINDLHITKPERPVKIVQFGEGNFLRAFVDWMVDITNEKTDFNGSIAIVKPISFGNLDRFDRQNCIYTVVLRGQENGEVVNTSRIVTSVDRAVDGADTWDNLAELAKCSTVRFVVSNTTEAGIVLDETDTMSGVPSSYPGKLTKFLFERYIAFNGAPERGVIVLPVELIENNGGKLRECVFALAKLWNLPEGFTAWLKENCTFCSTLVDRIVTGYPAAEAEKICEGLGYKDELLDVGEPFALWVIESDRDVSAELPFESAGLPVVFTDNQKPYRERKVRILNGAHTSFVPAAFLSGEDIVRDCMAHSVIRPFIDTCIYNEIMPTLDGKLDKDDLLSFSSAVCERFENPFIDHALISICLNSVSKWKARVLPSVIDSLNKGVTPACLIFSFAALCHFYARGKMTENGFIGTRTVNGASVSYTVSDNKEVLDFFGENPNSSDILKKFASNTDFWGIDLTTLPGFAETAQKYYDAISDRGILSVMEEAVRVSRGE
ncbi:MAG: tagaturonate reductase [Clostridia bacterium]|nr:tagaturonate reductase [Clostridia bacterium]